MDELLIEAYDDGFFPPHCKGGRCHTFIAGVESSSIYPRRIAWMTVKVDLNTSIKAIVDLSRGMDGEVILLDGVTYAGFDVIDPYELHERTGKKIIVIQLYPLNLERIRRALERHFSDWIERFSIIQRVTSEMFYYTTPWRAVRLHLTGITKEGAARILARTMLYSPVPEPLRLADKIASSLSHLLHTCAST